MSPQKAPKSNHINLLLVFIIIIGLFWLSLCASLIWNAFKIRSIYLEAEHSHKLYFKYSKAAQMLRAGSDYLTDQVRIFAATGDIAYLNNYFHEAKLGRRRDQAVETVRNISDNDEDTLRHLRAALSASRQLMFTEYHSMKLIAISYGIPASSLPAEVSEFKLTEQELALPAAEQRNIAYKILFDNSYTNFKESIWGSINIFTEQNIQHSQTQYHELTHDLLERCRTQIIVICFCIVLLLMLFIASFILNNMRVKLQRLHLKQEKELIEEKAKSFFFASVSHDIRTPLNAIIGFSELLQGDDIDEDTRKQYLRSINVSGQNLMQLINDLLDLSKLEADKMQFTPQPTDIRQLMEDLRLVFAQQAKTKGISLSIDSPPIPTVFIDPQRVSQILFNLVGNAMKFTSEGGIVIKAEFMRDSDSEGTLSLSVCDTGSGISSDDLGKLTKPYVQLKNSQTKKGTGLGLAICKLMLKKMDGELDISSTVGKGSTFAAVMHVHYDENATPVSTDNTALLTPLKTSAPIVDSVLLVDDSPINLTMLKAMCARFGVHHTMCAHNGKEALETLSRKHFELVLTDLQMPVMDGEEFVAELRKTPELKDIQVNAITADVEVQKTYAEMGFDGVLIKPVTLRALQRIIAPIEA